MLRELVLQNFRGFADHSLSLQPTTVMVGRNNAGKTTVIEALKLTALVVNRCTALTYRDPPDDLNIPRRLVGVRPSLEGMEFEFTNVCYRYGDPPAVITAIFNNSSKAVVYLEPERTIFAALYDKNGHLVQSKSHARRAGFPTINVLPQVAPLAREEQILTPEYVRRSLSTSLSPYHFRNQLNLLQGDYGNFRRLAEATWPRLKIDSFIGRGERVGSPLSLLIRDGDFVAEVGWMDHGLQIWLQTMWFLARLHEDDVIILDEPDVYLHADLQRKLVRYLNNVGQQRILATHSVEIMSEVPPEDILVVEKRKGKSKFATSNTAVQKVIDDLGGIHNIHLTRLTTSRKLILVEGNDLPIMKAFQDAIFPNSQEPFDAVPNMPIGGWHGWQFGLGSTVLLKNEMGEDLFTYCILDRDHRTREEIRKRYGDAKKRNVILHIWRRKEIENYLLAPSAITRVINLAIAKKKRKAKDIVVEEEIFEIIDKLKDSITDSVAEHIIQYNRKLSLRTANKEARDIVKKAWKSSERRLNIAGGKEVLARLSNWSQEKYGASLSAIRIARQIREEELPHEVREVITMIEERETPSR
ncbi:MAG: AAA family ATPase [Rhodospirillales bacterium]|nr:AAA family ATPase [Rhodospirillales bacterium]